MFVRLLSKLKDFVCCNLYLFLCPCFFWSTHRGLSYTFFCTHTHTYLHTDVLVCTHTHTHTQTHTRTRRRTHVLRHSNKHTHTNTQTHAQIYTGSKAVYTRDHRIEVFTCYCCSHTYPHSRTNTHSHVHTRVSRNYM